MNFSRCISSLLSLWFGLTFLFIAFEAHASTADSSATEITVLSSNVIMANSSVMMTNVSLYISFAMVISTVPKARTKHAVSDYMYM